YAQSKKDAHLQKAHVYFTKGKYAEAIIELKNALQIDPKDAGAYYTLGVAYLKQGRQEDVRQAQDALEKSVQLNPALTDAQLKLGELYLVGGQFSKAQERAQEILKNDVAHIEARILLSRAYEQQREVAKAIEILHQARKLDPARLQTYFHLARLYEASG